MDRGGSGGGLWIIGSDAVLWIFGTDEAGAGSFSAGSARVLSGSRERRGGRGELQRWEGLVGRVRSRDLTVRAERDPMELELVLVLLIVMVLVLVLVLLLRF